jgi:hypothetical protein
MSKRVPAWVIANAWREILARIFENIQTTPNVSPEWLVNPATHRRLKLDMLYPEIGVAVRLEGLTGKQGRQRLSLEEEEQAQMRVQARHQLCRTHQIELIMIDLGDEPKAAFRNIDTALSRAGRQAKNTGAAQQINRARTTATGLSRQITGERDLQLYADLWQDRQYQVPESAGSPTVPGDTPSFKEGLEVEHPVFGPGVIVAVTPGDNDTLLSVDFVTAGQKTLAASLVAGKLVVRS